jgi:hypothetical protein
MPYFTNTRRRLWNLLIVGLIVTALLHEPTFEMVLHGLINLHIFARVAFNTAQRFVAKHEVYQQTHDFISAQYYYLWSAVTPALRTIATYLMRYAASWILGSPRYLCNINTSIAQLGDTLVNLLIDDNNMVGGQWSEATKSAGRFCVIFREHVDAPQS